MSVSLALFSILGALLLGAITPGPSFVLISRIAVMSSRRGGIAAGIGMGLGSMVFATLALLGLVAVLLQVEWLYLALRVLGGLYLLYLGICMWRGASQPLTVTEGQEVRQSSIFRLIVLGFVTQVCNPKTAIVYASIFAAFLPSSTPAWLFLSLPPLVFALETTWYSIVALVFSAPRPRSIYLRYKTLVDRVAGAVLGTLGARFVSETFLAKH